MFQCAIGVLSRSSHTTYVPQLNSYDVKILFNLPLIIASVLPKYETLPREEWRKKLHASALCPMIVENNHLLTCIFKCGYGLTGISIYTNNLNISLY
jgi:hypothetical protein